MPCVCLSVCLSVTSRSSIETAPNRVGFWHRGFLLSILHCVKGNSGILKNKGNFLWNFVPNVPNSGHRKFCFGISIFETCYRLSSTQSVTGLSWQYLRAPTLDRCSLSQWSSSSVCRTIINVNVSQKILAELLWSPRRRAIVSCWSISDDSCMILLL